MPRRTSFAAWTVEQPYDGVTPVITPVVTSANNTLPYAGELSATLYLGDVTGADVIAIRDHDCAFDAANPHGPVRRPGHRAPRRVAAGLLRGRGTRDG